MSVSNKIKQNKLLENTKSTSSRSIPTGWSNDILTNVCIKFINGGTPSTKTEKYWNGNIPWITGADFSKQKINHIRRFITKEAINESSTNLIEKGNLLIVTRTGVGKITIAPFDIAISQDITGVYVNKKKITVEFLFHFLNYHSIRLGKLNQGTSISGITRDTLENINIPLPPISEQKKIVQILDTWDKAIETTEKSITAKEQFKNGLMQKLLSGKKRFEGFEKEKWEVINFIDLSDKSKRWSFTGGPFGSNLKASDYKETGIRIIQLQNIGDGTFYDDYKIYTSKEKADELLSCNIYPGEIIISKMGDPVARACFIPHIDKRYLMASDGIRLSIDEKKFDKKFIHDYINHSIFRKKAIEASTGSTRQRIGLDDLKKLTLKVPSKKEQEKIGKLLSSIDKDREKLEQKLSNLKEQKKGLMQVLLTGKIRVKI